MDRKSIDYYLMLLNHVNVSPLHTAWKVSKYGVFSGSYLDTFHTVSLSLVTTAIWIIFSRFGINENWAEFLANYFVPIIQDSRKVLV